jgi:hypothetical protein
VATLFVLIGVGVLVFTRSSRRARP